MRPLNFTSRLLASTALVALLALSAAGCTTTGSSDVTGSIGSRNGPATESDWRRAADAWGERYRANTKDPEAAIRYAQALRATDQRSQAAAVLEHSSMENPHNKQVLGAYGRALADVGRYEQALEVLSRAHTPDQPDWKILNVQGAVLDQLGRHDDARRHYSSALKIRPDEASVLSNLGLSYALTNDLKRAEETLRRAAAQRDAGPKVRQNLALVIGLQGRFDEAERIVRADLPAAEAEANVAYLRDMLAQHDDWKSSGSKRQVSSKPVSSKPATGKPQAAKAKKQNQQRQPLALTPATGAS
jgi:Flp pilus assembly protein TadD